MNKARLAVRVPEELDLAIENLAKQHCLKKQDLVIKLLQFGLVLISNAKNLDEVNQTNWANPNSKSSNLIQSHSMAIAQTIPLTSEQSIVKGFEKRLTALETVSEASSRQLAEIIKLIELSSTINRRSDDSANATDKVPDRNTLVATFARGDIEQSSTALATDHTKYSQGVEEHSPSPDQREISTNLKLDPIQDQNDDVLVRLALLAESLPSLMEQSEEIELKQNQKLSLASAEFVSHGKETHQALQTQTHQWAELIEDPQEPRQRRRRRNRVICVEDE